MSTLIKALFAAGVLLAGASSSMAVARVQADPSVTPIHLDNAAVPAKQYFEEMQRDGN